MSARACCAMQKSLVKWAAGTLILLLVVNLLLFAMRKISSTLFWTILGVAFLGLHLLKKLNQKSES